VKAASRVSLGWLLPRPDEPGRDLARRIRVLLTVSLVVANLLGALIVAALGLLVVPLPDVEDEGTARAINLAVAGAYLLVFMPLGTWWGLKRLRQARAWLEEDREPTDEERVVVLRGPRRIVGIHVVIWAVAAVVFGALNATFSPEAGLRVASLITFAGVVTCAFVYLIAERQLRPAAARALAAGIGDRRLAPGVTTRTLVAWAIGSAVPVLGLMVTAISTLVERDFTRDDLALLVLVVSGVTVVFGAFLVFLAARAIADPVVALRQAVRSVGEGDLEVEVPVYDGSEIGQLQVGFNDMVAGLRERERIRDLFGRQVGEEVAGVALEQEVELGGEVRTVAILFCDVVGSTAIAAERDPHEVVEMLNAFFAIVVEVVREHGGWVNKFEGDAALAVFGAPLEVDDPGGRALAAARELSDRLPSEPIGLEAAIGVSCGEVVAGNVGEERRFEYTVIGDPVNEAARLTELAKSKPGMVLASAAAVEAASEEEASHWQLGESVELRGRSGPTRLASPSDT
jgi:adenylate cyclase